MKEIHIVPVLYLDGENGYWTKTKENGGNAFEMAAAACNNGADAILVVETSAADQTHDRAIEVCRDMVRSLEAPLYLTGNLHRFEDIKKYLYTGAAGVLCLDTDDHEQEVCRQGIERFGEDKVKACHDWTKPLSVSEAQELTPETYEEGILTHLYLNADGQTDFFALKSKLKENGFPVLTFEPSIAWSQLKKDQAGLVPCIVQDYRTGEVLMMAYMNETAYLETARTGKMCYYSRSRQNQWLKGETSGHFQYVKSLYADCDQDTLLAKVAQVGAACHTGSYSCFFNRVFEKEGANASNPHKVFEDVYQVIMDRKLHPKEGSYTNYLFDKGIDKILKKCGEEATEIVIAAKNPDPEEIKYEIADFLYHVMVLMVQKGVTWEDITRELANR